MPHHERIRRIEPDQPTESDLENRPETLLPQDAEAPGADLRIATSELKWELLAYEEALKLERVPFRYGHSLLP